MGAVSQAHQETQGFQEDAEVHHPAHPPDVDQVHFEFPADVADGLVGGERDGIGYDASLSGGWKINVVLNRATLPLCDVYCDLPS